MLGDTQTAATTTANLQAIGMSQEQLMLITDSAIGAWARYGDSIPIDGLAEAINETIQAGQVTGTFADVLNWAGTNEDDFNAKLAAANSTTERANIVLQELTRQGLAQAGQAWIDTNDDIVAANESQAAFEAAQAELGEKLSPVRDFLRDLGTGGFEFLSDAIDGVTQAIKDLGDWWDRTQPKLQKGWDEFWGIDESRKWMMQSDGTYGWVTVDGSHAMGLNYVPWDGYIAMLHQGERVLTAGSCNGQHLGRRQHTAALRRHHGRSSAGDSLGGQRFGDLGERRRDLQDRAADERQRQGVLPADY